MPSKHLTLVLPLLASLALAQDPPKPPPEPEIRKVPEQGFEPGKTPAEPLRKLEPEAKPPVRPGENASPVPRDSDPRANDRPAVPDTPPTTGKEVPTPAPKAAPKAAPKQAPKRRRFVEKRVWIPGRQELVCCDRIETYVDPCGYVHRVVVPSWEWVTIPGRWEVRLVLDEPARDPAIREGTPPAGPGGGLPPT